ncbi:GH39 family glycosyl hydrolase [Thermomonospora catenispora]|uniref:GH39 family glycosyl hydrolase n=1 Tax=Thermomonospora catenispora TaxID=2493090 RepID=UPI0011221C9A|nr:xylan 1,4-beta-xylosidase [Thermomonospora catenispora]TNY38538.1 xylan 1,4-beta-xylosidase [Thermomonospora catenispora]
MSRTGHHPHTSPAAAPPHRRRGRRGLLAFAFVTAIAVIAAVTSWILHDDGAAGPGGGRPGQIGVVGAPYRAPWTVWGFTHTDRSADVGPASDVAARALSRQPLIQNQHIMGWGADNPEPEPGRYDFSSLDRRIDYIRRTGGIPVITLCCAPDWMKGGRPGDTDWSRLEVAPLPEHYDDFARLAAAVARRYPDVRYFAVWNEMKGFFDPRLRRWNHEGYTRLYNLVYDAVKAVNPENKVGGPYVPMYSHVGGPGSSLRGEWGSVDQIALDAVEYWLTHKRGADFITIDGPTASDDRDVYPDEITALDKFTAINTWLRSKTDLPIWWNEYYIEPRDDPWDENKRAAMHAASLIDQAKSGAATVLYWNRIPKDGDRTCAGCLWVTTSVPDGGTPGRMLQVLQSFARWFPAGTPIIDVRASSPDVRVLAQPRKAVAVNVSDLTVRTRVGDARITLAPYEVRWLDLAY